MATKPKRGNRASANTSLPGQVVLVLQGGGALGAYQVGVYEALHEAGIEPDWIIGTSIGAINAALIAGNKPADRLENLHEFWHRVRHPSYFRLPSGMGSVNMMANLSAITLGIPAFFTPNPASFFGPMMQVGVENASYYSTAALADTLKQLVDFEEINTRRTRLTVGAVNVRTGQMRYFDNRDETLGPEHIMASGALPPAFPAVRIDDEPYWDGGIYSNTPIEAVLDDRPRRDSLIFAVQMWNPQGVEPQSIWQAMERQKDIQFSSRARSHLERQKQIHRLRHVIRELAQHLPGEEMDSASVRELLSWGCGTMMHVVKLNAPTLPGEDQTKDIDFTTSGIEARREAGYEHTRRMVALRPWESECNPIEGVMIYEDVAA